jgi:hypothetical protein
MTEPRHPIVEAAALALCELECGPVASYTNEATRTEAIFDHWPSARAVVLAALAAMKEPTAGMLRAVDNDGLMEGRFDLIASAWRAMVRELRTEILRSETT